MAYFSSPTHRRFQLPCARLVSKSAGWVLDLELDKPNTQGNKWRQEQLVDSPNNWKQEISFDLDDLSGTLIPAYAMRPTLVVGLQRVKTLSVGGINPWSCEELMAELLQHMPSLENFTWSIPAAPIRYVGGWTPNMAPTIAFEALTQHELRVLRVADACAARLPASTCRSIIVGANKCFELDLSGILLDGDLPYIMQRC